MAWTFPLIAPVSCGNGMVPNAPKHYETQQNMSFFPIGWIGCVRCDKSQRDFMAQSFELIAPVQPILHRVSCSNKMIPNAPKHNETFENISLGSNVVDWVGSLRKIPTWLRDTNFCINCTSSPHFAPSSMQLRNDPKCNQTIWDGPKD